MSADGQPRQRPPLRIILLTHFFAPEVGAAPNRLTRLAGLLQGRGHQVEVVAPFPTYPAGTIPPAYRYRLGRWEQVNGLPVHRLAVTPWASRRALARIVHQASFMLSGGLRALTLPRPDVLLVESHPLFVGLAGWAVGGLRRVPVVLNVSDLWPESAVAVGALRGRRVIQLAEWMERRAYAGAAEIIAMSRGIREGILRVVGAGRQEHVHLITNSVEADRFRPDVDGAAMRARFGLPPEAFVVGYLGNLGLAQKLETLLEAAHLLRDDPAIRVLLVGGGACEPELRACAARLALPNVIFGGPLPFERMPEALAAVDASAILLKDAPVFTGVLPSKIFEAMAAGKPIVATLGGEAADLIREVGVGIVAPPEDAAGLAGAIRRLQGDPALREQMGRRGRAYAEAHLSPQAITDRIEAVLYRAAGDRSGGEA